MRPELSRFAKALFRHWSGDQVELAQARRQSPRFTKRGLSVSTSKGEPKRDLRFSFLLGMISAQTLMGLSRRKTAPHFAL